MWKNFEFPIFYIPDTATTESLYECFREHNNVTAGLSWPLCSVQVNELQTIHWFLQSWS